LNDLVDEINKIIGEDFTSLQLFETGLLEYGYRRREEYDEPFYLPNTLEFYEVRDDFPRIQSSELSLGVENVSYTLSLNSCQKFRISAEKASNWAFDA